MRGMAGNMTGNMKETRIREQLAEINRFRFAALIVDSIGIATFVFGLLRWLERKHETTGFGTGYTYYPHATQGAVICAIGVFIVFIACVAFWHYTNKRSETLRSMEQ